MNRIIRYYFTSDWYHFYFHQIYTDFSANNKIKHRNVRTLLGGGWGGGGNLGVITNEWWMNVIARITSKILKFWLRFVNVMYPRGKSRTSEINSQVGFIWFLSNSKSADIFAHLGLSTGNGPLRHIWTVNVHIRICMNAIWLEHFLVLRKYYIIFSRYSRGNFR